MEREGINGQAGEGTWQGHLAEGIEETKGGIFEQEARPPDDAPDKLFRVARLGWLSEEAGKACQDVAAEGNRRAQQCHLAKNLVHLSNGLQGRAQCSDQGWTGLVDLSGVPHEMVQQWLILPGTRKSHTKY